MRKILSVIMTLALVLGLMSAAAITVSASPTLISTVDLGHTPPIGGFTAGEVRTWFSFATGYSFSNDQDQTIYKTDSDSPTLEDASIWTEMNDSEVLKTGGNYASVFTFTSKDSSYEFDPSVTVSSSTGLPVKIVDVQTDKLTVAILFEGIKGLPDGAYRLTVGDVAVTEKNAKDIFGNGTASYDAMTKTLTLSGAVINKVYPLYDGDYSGIWAYDSLTIELKGNNVIDLSSMDSTDVDYSVGIYAGGALTLNGNGNLTVQAGDAASWSNGIEASGDITLNVGGDWAVAGGASGGNSLGIYTNGAIYLEGTKVGAVLKASGRSADLYGDSGFYAEDFSVQASSYYGGLLSDVDWTTYYPSYDSYAEVALTAIEPTDYYLKVAGVPVTPVNKGNILGDGTAKYDPETKTLTLKNANLTNADFFSSSIFSGSDYAVIWTSKALTIDLVGNNTIDLSAMDLSYADSASGIVAESTRLTITGDGNLTVKGGNVPSGTQYGIWTWKNLFTDMKGDLSISLPKDQYGFSVFSSGGSVSLNMAGKWTFDIGETIASTWASVLYADNAITINNSGTGSLLSGNRGGDVDVVYAYNNVSIVNSGKLTVTGGDVAGSSDSDGIYSSNGDISIVNDGTFTVTTGDAGDDAYGIIADWDLTIVNNGTMTVTTGDAADDSDALECYRVMDLSGKGTLTVATGDGYNTSAIYCDGALTIGGEGTYNFSTGTSKAWNGCVYGGDCIEIADAATVTATADKSSNGNLNGFYTDGSGYVAVSTSGDVTVTAGKAYGDSSAIETGAFTYTGTGNVTATAGKANYSYGICAYTVVIDGPGNLSFVADASSANSYGIYASNLVDPIYFAGTDLDNTIYAEGATVALYQMPTFDPDFYAVKAAADLGTALESVGLNVTNYGSFKAVELTSLVKTVEEITVIYGDANDDTGVDMKDVLVIRKYIASLIGESQINLANADANGDTSVDMKDVLIVRKFISNLVTKLGPVA